MKVSRGTLLLVEPFPEVAADMNQVTPTTTSPGGPIAAVAWVMSFSPSDLRHRILASSSVRIVT